MGDVIAGLVEQAVPDTPAQHHAQHAEEQDVLDVPAGPLRQLRKRQMLQAARAQKVKKGKGGQVSQAIPVNRQRAQLHGHRVDRGMLQHQSPSWLRSRTAPLSALVASLA